MITKKANLIRVLKNVNFTKNLFKNSILSGVNKFLFLSTIKVYGETTSLKNKLTENDQINPLNKYSQSKYFAEEEIVKSSSILYLNKSFLIL